MADMKGMLIEVVGIGFVLLGAINSATKDGIAGLVRLGTWLQESYGPDFISDKLILLGNDYSTSLIILLGILFLIYRGRWLFGILKKYLPIK